MVVGVDNAVIALDAAQQFNGPVGNDLVGVHIGRRARAALDGVHNELVVELAADDLVTGGDDGLGLFLIQGSGVAVGHGGGLFDLGQADNQQLVHGVAGDGKILLGPQGLDAVIGVGRDFQCADGVGFHSGFHKTIPSFSWVCLILAPSIHADSAAVKTRRRFPTETKKSGLRAEG